MAQEQVQIQKAEQGLKQTQNVTQQQMLQAHLTELPINQLIERVTTEMDDNPALEAGNEDGYDSLQDSYDDGDTQADEDFDARMEREDRQSALDDALSNIGRDDEELPVYHPGATYQEEREDIVYGNVSSFYDSLNEQMGEIELTPKEQDIMEYLIGSLDDDGLLRKSSDAIADELAIYHNMNVSAKEIDQVVGKLQEFDPAGIGAHDLQECLLLQIERRDDSKVKKLMTKVIKNYFDDFTKKRWDKIQGGLKLTELQAEALSGELRKLNPKPGAAMSESVGRSLQQITPDFYIDTQDDGTVTFALNNGELPELHVSQSFADMMKEYQDGATMSRQMKEALLYTKKKVEAAQNFIDAISARRRTLTLTIKAIINWQHRYFEDGDESSLKPMRLKDIAEKTGLDISTISRVSNSKYAQTRWGVFPLRHFFNDGYVTDNGEELSTRQIKATLREIVDAEDKDNPLSDDEIKEMLAGRGYPIARRTVAKYREQLGIPVARLRK